MDMARQFLLNITRALAVVSLAVAASASSASIPAPASADSDTIEGAVLKQDGKSLLGLVGPLAASTPASGGDLYQEDMAFALDELKKQCGGFFRLKQIKWNEVEKEFKRAAKKVRTDTEHLVLLQRLISRLKDGHARVEALEKGKNVPRPEEWTIEKRGPGLFLCQIGKRIYIKNAWSSATAVGLAAGMEVLSIDGQKMAKWLPARIEELSDTHSFSTDQQALFYALHRGLARETGSRLKLEYKTLEGKKKKRTITIGRASLIPNGPAFPPQDYETLGDSIRIGHTEEGYGYIHFRRTKDKVLEELDSALAKLGPVPGMILDFRGNSGGGCDHDAFEARFVPKGQKMPRMARSQLASQGETPYGGPIIVIVDGTTVSAGETTSGMFKQDGRAYMIGESATAGMSSQKTTIELPSRLFALYVSTRSNRSSYNKGRGIEGIGVAPQELVEFDPDDLAAGVDTLIRRAEELLGDYPKKAVKYDPKEYGWEG
jgi:C-terminal processing protease CtpA/Prc